jgi:hypothetical protein
MKKSSLAVLLVVSSLCFSGCKRVATLDNDPDYRPMIGKLVKLRQDMVIMKYKDNQKKFVVGIPGTQDVPSLKDMPKEFPFDYFNQTIYGMLPKNTMLEVMHIERVSTVEFSFVDIYTKVKSDGKFNGYTVDVGVLTDQTKKVPVFEGQYVEEMASVAGK